MIDLAFRCNRYRPWCETVTLSDGKEYVFLGGGDPDTCDDGIEGIEEYDADADKWSIAERHSSIDATGPSITVGNISKFFIRG